MMPRPLINHPRPTHVNQPHPFPTHSNQPYSCPTHSNQLQPCPTHSNQPHSCPTHSNQPHPCPTHSNQPHPCPTHSNQPHPFPTHYQQPTPANLNSVKEASEVFLCLQISHSLEHQTRAGGRRTDVLRATTPNTSACTSPPPPATQIRTDTRTSLNSVHTPQGRFVTVHDSL